MSVKIKMHVIHRNRRDSHSPSVGICALIHPNNNELSNSGVNSTALTAFALADSPATIQKALSEC